MMMHILMPSATLIRRCAAISSSIWYSITLAICIGMSGFWYWFVYRTLDTTYVRSQREIQQAQSIIGELQNVHKQCTLCNNALEMSKRHFHEYRSQYSFDNNVTRMAAIFDHINKCQLLLRSYTPAHERDKQWYTTGMVMYVIKGSFASIVHFFKTLKHVVPLVQCKYIDCIKIEEGVLQVTCKLDFIALKKELADA